MEVSETEYKYRERLPGAESAQRIWNVVAPLPSGLPAQEIMARAALKECQFNYGKGIVRNFKAKDEGKAFFYDGYAYVITTDPTLCAGGVTYRLKCIDSELESLEKATIAPLDKDTVDNDLALKYVAKHLAAARKELKAMKEHGFIPSSFGEENGKVDH